MISNWMGRTGRAGALLALLLVPLLASAGQSCEDTPLSTQTLRQAMATAQKVTAEMERRQDNVALVGRVGQDLSSYGLKYSHVGIIYRNPADGRWRIAHLLNSCGTAQSDLWYEGVGNFFLDDMFSYDAVLIVPPKQIADRLLPRLQDGAALRSVHDINYSLVSYPFSTQYQNSNTWVLETLAAVEARDAKIVNREQAQAWLKLAGYQPSEMKIGTFKRLGGRVFKANVAFDDHPAELRFSDRIRTVTVDSVMRFLADRKEGWQVVEIPAAR
ncbi:DUF2145 domain-containing protein [Cupriavidus sp. YAF13]|uniref:DUF2145 domain-containing protein n=1 Tax=Cupriavidus sp. YAF13 TaxID=3233075 RepID=UPI003F8D9535